MYITYLDYYVPENKLSLNAIYEDIKLRIETKFKDADSFIKYYKNNTLTNEISIENNKSKEEMLLLLIDKALKDEKIKEKVKYIILADNYKNKFDNFGHYIQWKYNIKNANILNLSGNYCANIELSILQAKNLLSMFEDESYILILTGNKLENNYKRLVGSYAIISDATGIILMSNKKSESSIEVKDIIVKTNGSLYQMDMEKDNTVEHYKLYKEAITNLLYKSNITPAEIDYILLHNANTILQSYILKTLGFDIKKIFINCERNKGHLDTVDLILNLKNSTEIKLKDNLTLMSLSIGAPGTYVAGIFKA